MAKNSRCGYAGKIGTAGAQEVEPAAPRKKSGAKKAVVHRGKDLREGK